MNFTRTSLAFLLSFAFLQGAWAQSFDDVSPAHPQYIPIEYLKDIGVVEGYSDGTFKPYQKINRAEFLKILFVTQGISPNANTYRDCFPDVTDQWFAPFVCYAKELGIVEGYPDGFFHPEQTINTAESLKLVLESFDMDTVDYTAEQYWYDPYLRLTEDLNLMDLEDLENMAKEMNRGDSTEFLFRTLVYEAVGSKGYTESKRNVFLELMAATDLIPSDSIVLPVNIVMLSENQEATDSFTIATLEGLLQRINTIVTQENPSVQFELRTFRSFNETQNYTFCSLAEMHGDLSYSQEEWYRAISECTYLEIADSTAVNVYLVDDSSDKHLFTSSEPYLLMNWEDALENESLLEEQVTELLDHAEEVEETFYKIAWYRATGEWYFLSTSEITYDFQASGPWYNPDKGHMGVDYKLPMGTLVNSPIEGEVVLITTSVTSMGLTLVIKDAEGLIHIFAHLSDTFAKEGDHVDRGDPIAFSGVSGTATEDGPHLHYEIISPTADPGAEHMTRTFLNFTGYSINPHQIIEELSR